jgi:hypothetical protein
LAERPMLRTIIMIILCITNLLQTPADLGSRIVKKSLDSSKVSLPRSIT